MKLSPNVIPAPVRLLRKSGILYPLIILFTCVILFWEFFFRGLIPLPADTIVGMYHPWRDFYAKNYPNGIPFNNPLITDPVRQQFIWKKLVIDDYKVGQLPIDNPYSFSGYPLLANFQSGAFYPLNLLFFALPFNFAWGMYIFLQFFLGALFMFWYLRNLLRNSLVSFMGSIVWILSGFWISWAEWGNILHTALWLPLILLSIDKITSRLRQGSRVWLFVYLISLCFSFFAGHLQTFFYLYMFSLGYLFFRLRTTDYILRTVALFLLFNFLFFILTFVQWYPTLQFILVSARSNDIRNVLTREDWFIPLKHLIQLVIPDYFGNPAKGNYWGVWNYGEYLSYIGIIPLFFAVFAVIKSIKSRKNTYWVIMLGLVFLFSLKNPISEIPYRLQIPFFSTAQPSRLIFLLDFILIIFFCQGLINLYEAKSRGILMRHYVLFAIAAIFAATTIYQTKYQQIIMRNSIQPLIIYIGFLAILSIVKNTKILLIAILLLIFADQARVFSRFTTFAMQEYIYPETATIKFLKQEQSNGFFRIASLNPEIMPPNFAAYYKIVDIGGYDPLYYKAYAEMFAGRKNPNFNRILQLTQVDEKLFAILKVKYVLTFADLPKTNFKLVFREGKTKTYENLNYHSQL